MPGLVLTYHSMNMLGNEYANNDHVALAQDLPCLDQAGFTIVPLSDLVDAWETHALAEVRWAAITFDDGGMPDALDVVHPTYGPQTSFLSILREFAGRFAATQTRVHASSFVIVSPQARAELDHKDFLSLGWWGDDWWRPVSEQGMLAIESHSWDHNHPSLANTLIPDQGHFDLQDLQHARAEVELANAYITQVTGRRPQFMAYPWGQSSAFLRDEYFPLEVGRHQLRAAFGTTPSCLLPDSQRWNLPRFVCGDHWRSRLEFQKLLVGEKVWK
jgi:peptidoglycan/xylan/chitin deacetylase (PgdA/CDA1 family)